MPSTKKPRKPSKQAVVKALAEKPYRLNEREARIVDAVRKTGNLPARELVGSGKNYHDLKADNQKLRAQYRDALDEIKRYDERFEILTGLEDGILKYTEFALPAENSKDESAAILTASDWHFEERVDAEGVNGINEFNPAIAETRIKRFFERGLFLIRRQRELTRIDTLVLALLGDLITGYIHDELVEDNYLSPPQAAMKVVDLVKNGLDFLLAEGGFKKIVVPCCYGNHGRTTIKTRASTGWKNSFEFMMYTQLALHYRGDPRVHFQIEQGYHTYVDLFGWPIRFHHGDAIRYAGGVGGPTIPILKKIAAWDKTRWARLDVFGHLHEPIAHYKFVMNGSLIGYNPFALRLGCGETPPQQWLIMVDKKFGPAGCIPVFLDDSEKSTAAAKRSRG